jgi:hypothetical protein
MVGNPEVVQTGTGRSIPRSRPAFTDVSRRGPRQLLRPELAEEPALSVVEWDHVVGSGCLLLGWKSAAPAFGNPRTEIKQLK